jgi:guanine deaminase
VKKKGNTGKKTEDERALLMHAIRLAESGISDGGGPFGAVITKSGEIISEAYNMVVLSGDPTAHAEIIAIRKAAVALGSYDLSGCVIYSSCEPCPMCLGAIYWSGIKRVVYASDSSQAASYGFSDSLIYDEINKDPDERKIDFIQIEDTGAEEVFRKWDKYEKKVRY